MAMSTFCKLEMIYYCYQYEELKEELSELEYNLHSINFSSNHIVPSDYQSNVEKSAIRASQISRKVERIEKAVRIATKKDPALYPYLLKAVTDECCTCDYLIMHGLPCSRNTLYRYKKKVYEALGMILDDSIK